MTIRRKLSIIASGLLLLIISAGVFLYSGEKREGGAVTFQGWTNINGERHAIFQLPPVMESGLSNNVGNRFFYLVQLEWTRIPKSRWGSMSFPTSPNVITSVPIPADGEGSLRVTSAKGWVERKWKKLPILPLPRTYFIYTPSQPIEVPSSEVIN